MPSFSQAVIMGHLTRDVESRQAGSHTVYNFAVAVSKKKGDQETVSYFDCTAWNQTGEFISKWFKKGMPILVTGEIVQETWDDKQTGAKRSKMAIIVDRATFAGDGQRGGGKGNDNGEKRDYKRREGESHYSRNMGRTPHRDNQGEGSEQLQGAGSGKDEIPFGFLIGMGLSMLSIMGVC